MRARAHPGVSTPDSDLLDDERYGSFRRVLVPVDTLERSVNALRLAARTGRATGGRLRLVHVRVWDLPAPRDGGLFYPERSEEATALLDNAMRYVWDFGVEASGVVVDAPRSSTGTAIIGEASRWAADVIVLTARLRRFLVLGVWDKATRQVMRTAACPVLVVHPGRR